MSDIDPEFVLCSILAFVVGVTIHEFAHAITIDRAGDDTPRLQGRLTLNPIDHLDPIGTVAIVISSIAGFGFGWGKPVMFNPTKLKHPRADIVWTSFAGPLSNLILAGALAVVLRIPGVGQAIAASSGGWKLVVAMMLVNLTMFLFNLIPVPPLDGYKILVGLLPGPLAEAYAGTVGRAGQILFLILVMTGVAGRLVGPAIFSLAQIML